MKPVLFYLSTCFALSIATLAGCGSGGDATETSSTDDNLMLQTSIDQLKLASDYVFSEERFETEAFNDDVSKLLNQWANSKPTTVDWELDPLVETWPAEIRRAADSMQMGGIEFDPKDAQYLQQAAWAKAIARWIDAQPQRLTDYRYLLVDQIDGLSASELSAIRETQQPVTFLLQKRYHDLDDQAVADLALAWQLFDWTVRNIQLTELRTPPSPEEIQLFALNKSEFDLPAAMGVPGPGYTYLTDQVLNFGKGDAWQRGRVFSLLARETGLDVAWIGIKEAKAANDTAQPWVVTVSIGDQAFLFDPALGIPIPSKQGGGIATLAEARENNRVLRDLNVADFELSGRNRRDIEYVVQEIEDDRLVLIIDASPTALSKRMQMVESSLTGDRRLRLSLKATELAERIQQTTQLDSAILWDVPVLAYLYRKAFDQAARFQNPRVGQTVFEEQLYDMPCPIKRTETIRSEAQTVNQTYYEFNRLRTARHQALLGRFESESRSDRRGAKQLLLAMRLSDEEIGILETDEQIRGAFGVVRAGPAGQAATTTSYIKTSLRAVRATAALWLGLSHYDMGDPSSAMEWFDQVESFDELESWTDLTLYSRARSLEAVVKYPEAIRLYQASRSPQQASDAIRARILQALDDARNSDETEASADKGNVESPPIEQDEDR